VVGELDGDEVTASNGRYGPYLRKGTETRSLPADVSPLDVTLEQAQQLFAQPKAGRGGRGRGAPAGRPLGEDPQTGEAITVRAGRYGPYVSAGKVNATIPKSEDPEGITLERAAELLAAKRSK
jgi:DNA topoisomerase-1